jgi:4-hydroxythreonine-4-phosphate dehydrogenase
VVGDPVLYGARAAVIDDASEAVAAFAKSLPVLPRPLVEPAKPGAPSVANAGCVLASIDEAIDAVEEGRAAAIVTNPISKAILHRAGFDLPGHTEYLAQRSASEDDEAADGQAPARGPVMMLVGGGIRVALATIHVPLRAVPDALTVESVVNVARVTAAALARDFGVEAPAIALCGLNPHAGESGDIGVEEIEIINPAAKVLREDHGLDVTDALAADGLFSARERARYDAIIAMYHDQGLVPVKALDFDNAVNVTLGLDVVRTSPDHGVAFGIAGQGVARPDSLIAAIELAAEIAARRATAARQIE